MILDAALLRSHPQEKIFDLYQWSEARNRLWILEVFKWKANLGDPRSLEEPVLIASILQSLNDSVTIFQKGCCVRLNVWVWTCPTLALACVLRLLTRLLRNACSCMAQTMQFLITWPLVISPLLSFGMSPPTSRKPKNETTQKENSYDN